MYGFLFYYFSFLVQAQYNKLLAVKQPRKWVGDLTDAKADVESNMFIKDKNRIRNQEKKHNKKPK